MGFWSIRYRSSEFRGFLFFRFASPGLTGFLISETTQLPDHLLAIRALPLRRYTLDGEHLAHVDGTQIIDESSSKSPSDSLNLRSIEKRILLPYTQAHKLWHVYLLTSNIMRLLLYGLEYCCIMKHGNDARVLPEIDGLTSFYTFTAIIYYDILFSHETLLLHVTRKNTVGKMCIDAFACIAWMLVTLLDVRTG